MQILSRILISELFVNEKESWNSYCELAVDSYSHN